MCTCACRQRGLLCPKRRALRDGHHRRRSGKAAARCDRVRRLCGHRPSDGQAGVAIQPYPVHYRLYIFGTGVHGGEVLIPCSVTRESLWLPTLYIFALHRLLGIKVDISVRLCKSTELIIVSEVVLTLVGLGSRGPTSEPHAIVLGVLCCPIPGNQHIFVRSLCPGTAVCRTPSLGASATLAEKVIIGSRVHNRNN